jgi:dihydrofolate reductase
MRNVIYVTSISIDGYIGAENGDSSWVIPDEELHRHFNEQEASFDMHLYGRRMYELMAAYWPTVEDNPAAPAYEIEYAQIWKQMPKVVFSQTLDHVDWNAHLVAREAAAEVVRLKQQPGKAMYIGGSALATDLAAHDLIDAYHLYVMPTILGAGVPLFPRLRERINLGLIETQRFKSGAVLLKYRQHGMM